MPSTIKSTLEFKRLSNSLNLNILIAFYPIAYFFGNLAINVNTLLIIFAGIIIFKNKIFDFRSDKITIILLIF